MPHVKYVFRLRRLIIYLKLSLIVCCIKKGLSSWSICSVPSHWPLMKPLQRSMLSLWSYQSLKFWTTRSCSLLWNWFLKCKQPKIDKLMVITYTVVPLGLGSQLYPSSNQHMLNKDLTPFHAASFACTPVSNKWKKDSATSMVYN